MVFIKFLFSNVTPLFPIPHYSLWQSPYEQLILVEQAILKMEYLQNYFEFFCIDLYIGSPMYLSNFLLYPYGLGGAPTMAATSDTENGWMSRWMDEGFLLQLKTEVVATNYVHTRTYT